MRVRGTGREEQKDILGGEGHGTASGGSVSRFPSSGVGVGVPFGKVCLEPGNISPL